MELRVKRAALRDAYTIGRLYVDGVYFCDTLEDKVRPRNKKVWGKTAIPAGRYRVTMKVKSPKYSKKTSFAWTGGRMPRLLEVPNFEGILIHPGNRHTDTDGCILVGENKAVGMVLNSVATFKRLWPILDKAKEEIWITIE